MALEPSEIKKLAELGRLVKQEAKKQEEQLTQYQPNPKVNKLSKGISSHPVVTIKVQQSTLDELKRAYNQTYNGDGYGITYDDLILKLVRSIGVLVPEHQRQSK